MDGQDFQNEQNEVVQDGFKQNNAEQNDFEQNTAEQSNTEQNSIENDNSYYQDYTNDFNQRPMAQSAQTEEKNTLAIVSLVLGIISIVTGCCGSGFLFGIGGIVCCHDYFCRGYLLNGIFICILK